MFYRNNLKSMAHSPTARLHNQPKEIKIMYSAFRFSSIVISTFVILSTILLISCGEESPPISLVDTASTETQNLSRWASDLDESALKAVSSGRIGSLMPTVVTAAAPPATATVVDILATDDVHVKYNDCNNYEGLQFLKLGQTATDDYYTLMHFDVSSIPPGSVITRARLKMRVDNAIGATPRPVRLYEIVGSWTASGVSWCNIPSKGHFLDEVSPPNAGAAIWEGDLMKLVQCWVDGLCPNDGVALAAPGNFTGAYRFYAVESGPPSHPKIQVEY